MASGDVSSKVIRAVALVVGQNAFQQVLRLASNLILTRLLAPELFGVVALANTLVVGAIMFTDAGLGAKLIQSEHSDDPRFVHTLWTLQVLRGASISALLLLATLGLWLARDLGRVAADSVYAAPSLPVVLAALSLTPFLEAFISSRLPLAQRNLAYAAVVRLQLVSQVLGIGVMVGYAWVEPSIWALVVGSYVTAVARVVMSHLWLPGRNDRFLVDRDYSLELFAFSRWIFLSSGLTFLAQNGDRVILGSLVTPTLMGQYAIAIFLVEAVRQLINQLANQVALPVFSEVARSQSADIAAVFYRARRWVDFATAVIAGGLFASGTVLIDLLYDDRYQRAGIFLQLLAASLIMVRYQLVSQLLLSLNRARSMSVAPLVRAIALFVLVPLAASRGGTDLAVMAITLSFFAQLPVYLYQQHQNGVLSWVREVMFLPAILLGYGLGLVFNAGIGWLGSP